MSHYGKAFLVLFITGVYGIVLSIEYLSHNAFEAFIIGTLSTISMGVAVKCFKEAKKKGEFHEEEA